MLQEMINDKGLRVSHSGAHSSDLLPISILPCLLHIFLFLTLKSQASFFVPAVNVSIITSNYSNYIIASKSGSWPLVSSHSQSLNDFPACLRCAHEMMILFLTSPQKSLIPGS